MPATRDALIIACVAVAVVTSACTDTQRSKMEAQAKAAGMTDAQFLTCEDFVNGKGEVSAEDATGKMEFARMVNKRAQTAGPELKDAGDVLARATTLNADGWKMGLDTFASACIKLGWPRSE